MGFAPGTMNRNGSKHERWRREMTHLCSGFCSFRSPLFINVLLRELVHEVGDARVEQLPQLSLQRVLQHAGDGRVVVE